jgi:hypothetical protein
MGFAPSRERFSMRARGTDPTLSSNNSPMQSEDPNGRAYNRTAHLAERAVMMQKWADYLDTLSGGRADVIPLRRAG